MAYCKDAGARCVAEDSELVASALTADEAGYPALVEKYWNLMVGLAVHQVGNITEAEDIAQEAFIQAYRRMATLRDHARSGFWLGRIVRNLCVDHLHSRGRAKLVSIHDLPERYEPAAPKCSSVTELNEAQRRIVREAMGLLPERFPQVLLMRFTADLPIHGPFQPHPGRGASISLPPHEAHTAALCTHGQRPNKGSRDPATARLSVLWDEITTTALKHMSQTAENSGLRATKPPEYRLR